MSEASFWQGFEQQLENEDKIVELAKLAGVPRIYLDSLNDRCEKSCGFYKKGWGTSLPFYIEIGFELAKR